MYGVFAAFQMQPEHRDDFIDALLDDARGSVETERGCVRFDVLRDEEDPNKVHIYEVYRDRAAVEAHGQPPHRLRWVETTREWRAGPAVIRWGTNIYPPDEDWK